MNRDVKENKKYMVSLHGCDDTTEIEIELVPDEVDLVKRLCEAFSKASTYGCQPTMEVVNLGSVEEDNE